MVVRGEQMAYTRKYWVASWAKSPWAPISWMSRGAAANSAPPTTAPVAMMSRQLQVKMLLASLPCFLPRHTEIGTAEPTPIKSARRS